MRAMLLDSPGTPLREATLPQPAPGPGQVLVKVHACGVCRTDLHIVDGELSAGKRPIIPGHEIAGEVVETGFNVKQFAPGDRIGVPWLGHTCGACRHCSAGRENLCDDAGFTGYTIDGGYAEYTLADNRYCLPLPAGYSDAEAAPLLIGYRAYRFAAGARRLGIYGFGAAAHIVAQLAIFEGRKVFAFTRSGDLEAQAFALELGAVWAGDSGTPPPEALDAAVIFAPLGSLVPTALRAVDKGGTVVCAGIHMSPIPSFPYEILWQERTLRSVANLTRRDAEEFLALAPKVPIRTTIRPYPFTRANTALADLRQGKVRGAAVLTMP